VVDINNYQIDGREWWVQRWLELLDSYRFKKRLERARNYAREGNVLSIEFGKNGHSSYGVLASVQGSEPQPYQVSLALEPFPDEAWDYVIETLSQKAIFSAQLLAGEMPTNIEQVFVSSGLSLFPFSLSDISSRCTCPDKANPCKHIGAVYYQLADRFSEDPFVLFQLRGRSKEQILASLRQLRDQKIANTSVANGIANKKTNLKDRELTSNLEKFWQYNEPLESSLIVIVPPTENKTVIDLLGPIRLGSADAEPLEQYLLQVYQKISYNAVASAIQREV
jgi:uncharacterized Zn finger protein